MDILANVISLLTIVVSVLAERLRARLECSSSASPEQISLTAASLHPYALTLRDGRRWTELHYDYLRWANRQPRGK